MGARGVMAGCFDLTCPKTSLNSFPVRCSANLYCVSACFRIGWTKAPEVGGTDIIEITEHRTNNDCRTCSLAIRYVQDALRVVSFSCNFLCMKAEIFDNVSRFSGSSSSSDISIPNSVSTKVIRPRTVSYTHLTLPTN